MYILYNVLNDTSGLGSTSILAPNPEFCKVHIIQFYVTEPIKKLAQWVLPRFEIQTNIGTYKTLFHYSHVRNSTKHLHYQH